jgi:hypothetical protein
MGTNNITRVAVSMPAPGTTVIVVGCTTPTTEAEE